MLRRVDPRDLEAVETFDGGPGSSTWMLRFTRAGSLARCKRSPRASMATEIRRPRPTLLAAGRSNPSRPARSATQAPRAQSTRVARRAPWHFCSVQMPTRVAPACGDTRRSSGVVSDLICLRSLVRPSVRSGPRIRASRSRGGRAVPRSGSPRRPGSRASSGQVSLRTSR